MDIETKIDLIKKPPTEEIIMESELKELLETNDHPGHYQGFEVSGKLHLGSLIVSGFKVNDFNKAGIKTQLYLAQWHGYINNKLDGDWKKINEASKYYSEAFQFFCPGTKMIIANEFYHNNDDYWREMLHFAKETSLANSLKCTPIMGRTEKDTLSVAQLLYPPMQATDIKFAGADIPHGGSDQRKVHMLAREKFPKLGWKKPIAVHHHLLAGLGEPPKMEEGAAKEERVEAAKMSKSKPWTCIFIHDTEQEIKEKLAKAWCPEKQVEGNPILEFARFVVFHEKPVLEIKRPAKFGGDVEFSSPEELEKAFAAGKVHPMDLKNAVAQSINEVIKPIREHFEKPKNAKLLEVYKEAKITR